MSGTKKTKTKRSVKVGWLRDKWIRIGLATGPCDRPKMEKAVDSIYKVLGLSAPRKMWLRSPVAGAMAATMLETSDELAYGEVIRIRDLYRSAAFNKLIPTKDWSESQQWIAAQMAVYQRSVSQVLFPIESAENREDLRLRLGRLDIEKIAKEAFDSIGVHGPESLSEWLSGDDFCRVGSYMSFVGHFNASALFEYEYVQTTHRLKIKGLDDLLTLGETGWIWFFRNTVILTERPVTLKLDTTNRPHGIDGPAIEYADGFSIWAWKGMRVPKEVILGDYTVENIDKEENAEIRRVMVDKYGQAKYLLDSGAKKVHEDDFGVLYSKELPGDEVLMMVKVVNSTPEPDGSYKDYFIRVDPRAYGGLKTARAAVASTWRQSDGKLVYEKPEDYNPTKET